MTYGILLCQSCGEPLDDAWTDCPACEAPVLLTDLCPGCGAASRPTWRRCPACKGELTPRLPVPSRGSGGPELPALEAGALLGPYRVERLVGRGGIGAVYAATDAAGAPLALKVIPALSDARPLVAELAAASPGPAGNVVPLRPPETAEAAGLSWVVLPMPLAAKSLRGWLFETAADPAGRLEEGLELFRQTCRGVAALHDAGFVHLDLKPENLLLFPDGEAGADGPAPPARYRLSVSDFALARSVRRLVQAWPAVARQGLGTPEYRAPEQGTVARPRDLTVATDVYALGVILYELLDGDVPFQGSAEEVRALHRDVEPPPLPERVRRHHARLVAACLAKDPAARPRSASEVLELVDRDPEEEAAVAGARSEDTEPSWGGFLDGFPRGRHAPEARRRLAELVAGREAREAEERRLRAEEAARLAVERAGRNGFDVVGPSHPWYPRTLHPDQLAEADRLAVPVALEERTSGIVLVLVPGGEYLMGASPGDRLVYAMEKPPHRVRVRPFYMGIAPVLQEQWERVTKGNRSRFRGAGRPVETVSWYDCQGFVEKVAQASPGARLRLPAEAEWERGARGGTATAWWWGEEWRKGTVNCKEGGPGETTAVGLHEPNPYGLLDTLGNVWEWCQDGWHTSYEGAPADGRAWETGHEISRVVRGGSWGCVRAYVRSSHRADGDPNDRIGGYGFRLVRDADLP